MTKELQSSRYIVISFLVREWELTLLKPSLLWLN